MSHSMSDPRPIEILREYHTYNFENSCVRNIEVKLTAFIPKEVRLFFMPFRSYLPDLKVKLHDGKSSPIFSYLELHRIIKRPSGRPFTLDEIRILASEALGVSEKEMQQFHSFAIILFPVHEDHINDIIIEYTEPREVEKKSYDWLTKTAFFTVNFPPTRSTSMYVALKVNDKYEIQKDPSIFKVEKIKTTFAGLTSEHTADTLLDITKHSILNDKKHNVVHVDRDFPSDIKIQFKVNVPQMLRIWLWFGLVLGIAVIPYSFLENNFQYIYPVILGIVALLLGLRILIFHDSELLTRWNILYLIIISLDIAVLVYMGIKDGNLLSTTVTSKT